MPGLNVGWQGGVITVPLRFRIQFRHRALLPTLQSSPLNPIPIKTFCIFLHITFIFFLFTRWSRFFVIFFFMETMNKHFLHLLRMYNYLFAFSTSPVILGSVANTQLELWTFLQGAISWLCANKANTVTSIDTKQRRTIQGHDDTILNVTLARHFIRQKEYSCDAC